MITRGPCSECGTPLASDQRYCINCGTRVGPPLALPYAPAPAEGAGAPATSGFLAALPMPIQMVTLCAALALGFGVIVGTALSPNLAGPLAGPVVVVQQPPAPAPTPEPVTGGGGGGGSVGGGGGGGASPVNVPSTTPTTSSGGDGSGGGGGKKKKKKEKKEKPVFISGTVVHTNPIAWSYTLARSGFLVAVHAKTPGLPNVGDVVRVPQRSLANRTLGEDGKRKVTGQASQVTVGGVVTFNQDSTDPAIPDAYTVSVRGASVLVHSPPLKTLPDGTTEDPALVKPPAVGTPLTVSANLADPAPTAPAAPDTSALEGCTPPAPPLPSPPVAPTKELFETSHSDTGPPLPAVEIETVVQAVCPPAPVAAGAPPGPSRILVSGDDARLGASDLLLDIDPALNTSLLTPGAPFVASVRVNGAFDAAGNPTPPATLTGVFGDQGIKGADDKFTSQGDLKVFAAPAGVPTAKAGGAKARPSKASMRFRAAAAKAARKAHRLELKTRLRSGR